jgi:hypothetical protein
VTSHLTDGTDWELAQPVALAEIGRAVALRLHELADSGPEE